MPPPSAPAPTIVGVGAVTGYGWGRDVLWDGLSSGKAAAVPMRGFGVAPDVDAWLARIPEGGDPADTVSMFSRSTRWAAREAISDAFARGWTPGRRVGLIHGVVLGDTEDWRTFHLDDGGERRSRDYLRLLPSTPISTVMQEFGLHGPAMNVSAACSTGNVALITAMLWLEAGMVDDVVVLTTDVSLIPENVAHFVRMGAAAVDDEPLQACRPFQEGTRGFAMGEAAVGFVLTGGSRAGASKAGVSRARGGYLRLLGGAMNHDGHHVTSVEPSLTWVTACLEEALAAAGVSARDIRYLNAHGPGTKQSEAAERALLDGLLAPARPHVFSIKPLVGHCQGAAAAVEIAASALGTERGLVPASPHVAAAHPWLLDGVTPMVDGLTLKPSLGMGGHNSALVLAPPL